MKLQGIRVRAPNPWAMAQYFAQLVGMCASSRTCCLCRTIPTSATAITAAAAAAATAATTATITGPQKGWIRAFSEYILIKQMHV